MPLPRPSTRTSTPRLWPRSGSAEVTCYPDLMSAGGPRSPSHGWCHKPRAAADGGVRSKRVALLRLRPHLSEPRSFTLVRSFVHPCPGPRAILRKLWGQTDWLYRFAGQFSGCVTLGHHSTAESLGSLTRDAGQLSSCPRPSPRPRGDPHRCRLVLGSGAASSPSDDVGEGPIQPRGREAGSGRAWAEPGREPRKRAQEESGTDSGPGEGPWGSSPAAHADPLPHTPIRASGLSPPRGRGWGAGRTGEVAPSAHAALGAAPPCTACDWPVPSGGPRRA